jgi:hypothetical protein
MIKPMEHDEVMEMAVQLTCSYLGSSHSGSTDAEELILSYYRQLRRVEARLGEAYAEEVDEEEEDVVEMAL